MKKFLVIVAALGAASCGNTTEKDDENNGVIVINNGASNNGMANNVTPNNGAQNNTVAPNNAAPNNAPQMGEQATAVRSGLTTPSAARDAGSALAEVSVYAVFEASIQATGGQQLVTTGTLTQNGQAFTYSASPNDRLRIVWSDGPPTDYIITAFDGDFTVEPDSFLLRDHVVKFRAIREGLADVEVSSEEQSGRRAAAITGTLVHEGVTYTANLSEVGTSVSDIDSSIGAAEYESETLMEGTISADNGFEQTVREYFRFKMTNSVTNDDRRAESQWVVNGKTYTLEGLRIRFEEYDGWPNPTDYWIVEGNVYEDGVLIGQAGYDYNDLWIEIFIDVGGERIELYNFQRRQE